jgi:hypothetical protein
MSRSKVTLWVRLLFGVAVIVGGPLILIAVLRTAYQSSPEPGKIDPGTFEFGKLGPSSPARRPTDSQRPPAAAQDMHATRLYECRKGGQLIYSGQPCGPDSIEREVNVRDANTSVPPRMPIGECVEAQKEIDQINVLMRQGYSSSEGELYRERLRRFDERMRELQCGR